MFSILFYSILFYSILFYSILFYSIVCFISQCFVFIFFMFHSNLVASSYQSNSILFICIFISQLFYFIILRGIGVESKPELQRVLEQRKREQVINKESRRRRPGGKFLHWNRSFSRDSRIRGGRQYTIIVCVIWTMY